jgi:hypothetical protein
MSRKSEYKIANYDGGFKAHPTAEASGTLEIEKDGWRLDFGFRKKDLTGRFAGLPFEVQAGSPTACRVIVRKPSDPSFAVTFELPTTPAGVLVTDLESRGLGIGTMIGAAAEKTQRVASGEWWLGIESVTVAINTEYLNTSVGTKSMRLGSLKVTEEGMQWRGNLGTPKVVMPWASLEGIVVDGEISGRVRKSAVATFGVFGLGAKKRQQDTHITVVTSTAEYGFLVEKVAPEVVRTKLRPVLKAMPSDEPTSAPVVTAPPVSIADELTKLAALRDQGILSPAEFEAQKAELLG